MSKITINIEYAGLQLAVGKNERGEDVTPLKPISDLFGLRWNRQKQKVTESAHLGKYLGVCNLQMWAADGQKREQICILVSRVAAFLMSISPDAARGQGNDSAADFLEQKLNEWADALHDYEEIGVAINLNHAKAKEALRRERMSFMAACKIKSGLPDEADRKASAHILKSWAHELGAPYQPDLLDSSGS